MSLDGLSSEQAFTRLLHDITHVLQVEREKARRRCWETVRDIMFHRCQAYYCAWFAALGWLCAACLLVCAWLSSSSSSSSQSALGAGHLAPPTLAVCSIVIIVLNSFNLWLTFKLTTWRGSEHLRKAERYCDRLRLVLQQLTGGQISASDLTYTDLLSPISESIDLQWTMRDGRLVNLPTLLVVNGDVLHVRPGRRPPVKCVVHTADGCTQYAHSEHIHSPEPRVDAMTGGVLPAESLACVSQETVAVQHVRVLCSNAGQRPAPLLTQQVLKAMHIVIERFVCVPLLALSIAAGIWMQWWSAAADDTASGLYYLFYAPAVVMLPVAALCLPIYMFALLTWHSAHLNVFMQKVDPPDAAKETDSLSRSQVGSSEQLHSLIPPPAAHGLFRQRMRAAALLATGDPMQLHQSANLLLGLGTATSVCYTDRKGVLSWPNPTTEKVFFLQHRFGRDERPSEACGSEAESYTDGFNQPVTQSRRSAVQPVVLDLSHDAEQPSRVQFDDQSWQAYLNSLRPIACNIRLNGCDIDASYTKLHDHLTTVSDSVPRTIAVVNRRCSCALAQTLGFSPDTPVQPDKPSNKRVIGVYSRQPGQAPVAGLTKHRTPLANLLVTASTDAQSTQHTHLMAQGTAELILQCCSHYWDGQRVRPLHRAARKLILDFYHRNSMTSYCLAFAYRPIRAALSDRLAGEYIDWPLQHRRTHHHHNRLETSGRAASLDSLLDDDFIGCGPTLGTAKQCIDHALTDHIFFGMTTMQYQAQHDVVHLVEQLDKSCIRFVHFSKENELRSRVFAEKLGIEAGWNCHISLAPEAVAGSLDWTHRILQYTRQETFNSRRFASAANFEAENEASGRRPSLPRELKVDAPCVIKFYMADLTYSDDNVHTPTSIAAPLGKPLDVTVESDVVTCAEGTVTDVSQDPDDCGSDRRPLMSQQTAALSRNTSRSSCLSESSGVVVAASVLPNKARLPVGIEQVRPHLQNVDNVPLLVSLFTDCDHESTARMINIMQEYGEVVAVVGSSLNARHSGRVVGIYSQADVSICCEPMPPVNCVLQPVPAQGGSNIITQLAGSLTHIACSHYMHAVTHGVKQIVPAIALSRHLVVQLRHSLWLLVVLSMLLATSQLLAGAACLPALYTPAQLLLFILVVIPALSASVTGTTCDVRQVLLRATGKNADWLDRRVMVQNAVQMLVACLPAACIVVLANGRTLYSATCPGVASDASGNANESGLLLPGLGVVEGDSVGYQKTLTAPNTSATTLHQWTLPLLCDRNVSAVQLDTAIDAANAASVLLTVVHMCVLSAGYVDYQQLGVPVRRNLGWLVTVLLVLLGLAVWLATAATQLWHVIATVPECAALLSGCLVLVLLLLPTLNLLLKRHRIKLFTRDQRRRKLNFGTKLGMNSPY